jgi:hypothetical protein
MRYEFEHVHQKKNLTLDITKYEFEYDDEKET